MLRSLFLLFFNAIVTNDGYPLGRWIVYQREKYNKNQLSESEIKVLEDIGMVWSTENHGGGQSFQKEVHRIYSNKHCRCLQCLKKLNVKNQYIK